MKKFYYTALAVIFLAFVSGCSDDDDDNTLGPDTDFEASSSVITSDGTIDLDNGFSYYNEDTDETVILLTDNDISYTSGSFFAGNFVLIRVKGSEPGTFDLSEGGDNNLTCTINDINRLATSGTVNIIAYDGVGGDITGNFRVDSFLSDTEGFQINSSSFEAERIDEFLLDDDDDDDDNGGGNNESGLKSFSLSGEMPDGSSLEINDYSVRKADANYISPNDQNLIQIRIDLAIQGQEDLFTLTMGLPNTNNEEGTIVLNEDNSIGTTFIILYDDASYTFFGDLSIDNAAENVGDNYEFSFNGEFVKIAQDLEKITNVSGNITIER